MTKHQTFTETIRDAIKSAPISRYRLSQLTGISQASLANFVNGHNGISSDSLDRIAPVLGLQLVVKGSAETRRPARRGNSSRRG